jgi:hypothetical protein
LAIPTTFFLNNLANFPFLIFIGINIVIDLQFLQEVIPFC